jgi:hypothetical protein
MPSALSMICGQRVRLLVTLFGRTTVMAGSLLRYSKPFLVIKTKEATRLLHESAVKEIIPLEGDLARLMEVVTD